MATNILYLDSQNTREFHPPVTVLTAPMLRKGRRLLKAEAGINTALSSGCMVLCGLCTAISILFLLVLAMAG